MSLLFGEALWSPDLAAGEISHGFLACGQSTYIVDGDGDKTWTYPAKTRDGYVLPNGNIVITSYAAGKSDVKAPKLIEVNRHKEVVWTYRDGQKAGIHHFQILDTNGVKLDEPPLK